MQHFFECAEQLQSAFRQPGQDVVWLLISDSLDIRSLSKTAFGDKLLVKLDEPSHVAGMTGHDWPKQAQSSPVPLQLRLWRFALHIGVQ